VRTGQSELANRRLQPLGHLSGVCFQQLITTALIHLVHSWCTLAHRVQSLLQLQHCCHYSRIEGFDVTVFGNVRFCMAQDALDHFLIRS